MADTSVRILTGLEYMATSGRSGGRAAPAGATLAVRTGAALASVMARKIGGPELFARAREAFDLDLPLQPRRTASGPIAAIWSGPEHWLVVCENGDGASWELHLRKTLGGLASVCDQTDGRLILRLRGARARDILAKGMPIDLHPDAFMTGHAALTLIGHTGVQIWQLDDLPTYDIAVFRSAAADLWRFIVHAGAEYGVEVLADDKCGV